MFFLKTQILRGFICNPLICDRWWGVWISLSGLTALFLNNWFAFRLRAQRLRAVMTFLSFHWLTVSSETHFWSITPRVEHDVAYILHITLFYIVTLLNLELEIIYNYPRWGGLRMTSITVLESMAQLIVPHFPVISGQSSYLTKWCDA